MSSKRSLNDIPATPWKNGGGITRELLRLPPDSDLDNFSLRVSVAEVGIDDPFSTFPGVDRTLLILQGDGMELLEGSTDTVWKTLATCLSPVQFEGEKSLVGRLTGGPIRDFNLMVRRSIAKGNLKVVTGSGDTHLSNCHCVFMARGRASVMQEEAVWASLQELDFITPPPGAHLVVEQDAVALVVSAEVF